MPRYVIAIADDPQLFDNARRALEADPRFQVVGELIHCDGTMAPLTNVYPVDVWAAEWEGWSPPGDCRADPLIPDPATSQQLIIECRSPAWIAKLGQMLAGGLDAAVWLIDSADVAWPADRVDPSRLSLD